VVLPTSYRFQIPVGTGLLIPDGIPSFEGSVGEQEELLRLWRERKIDGR
jgi:hypothetical protein